MNEWLVEDWYGQNGLHLLGGPVGSGKTGLEIGLMAAALKGHNWMGQRTYRPTKWVQIVTDRDLRNREYWAMRHGVALPGPAETYVIAEHPEDMPDILGKTSVERCRTSMKWLQRKLESLKPAPGGVVTIDVATPFFPPSQGEYGVGYWLGQQLKSMFLEMPSCYLLLSHGSKYNAFSSARRLVDRIIGNTGTLGVMDTLSYICTEAEAGDMKRGPGIQVFSLLPRTAAETTLDLVRDSGGRLQQSTEATPLIDLSKPEERETRSNAGAPRKLTLDYLITFFTDNPTHHLTIIEEIANRVDVSPKTVQRRFAEAQKEDLIIEVRPGYWIRKEA